MAKKKTVNTVNNDVSPIMMISIIVIFIIAIIFVTYFGMNLSSPTSKYFSSYNDKKQNKLSELLKKQKDIDNKIQDLSVNGGYTLDNPLVLKRPYELNPLTALIIFNTEEETRVEVSINDSVKTSVERSKNHIIPVYGLYADSNNFITLKLEDGTSKTIEMPIEAFDNNIYSFDVKSQIGMNDIYYMVGNTNDYNSMLRGFDNMGNMISYVSLDYIRGFAIYKNKIALSYNQDKDVTKDLRLDIDYMGRITSITSNTDDIDYTSNISSEDVSFIGRSYNLYSDLIGNYNPTELVANDSYDALVDLSLDEYEDRLTSANPYKGSYKISNMYNYIAYNFDKEVELLIVTTDGKLKSYKVNKEGIIRVDINANKSLYINDNGTIYSLRTTLIA